MSRRKRHDPVQSPGPPTASSANNPPQRESGVQSLTATSNQSTTAYASSIKPLQEKPMSEAETANRPKPRALTPGRTVLSGSDQDNGQTENALLLGIDLGTSRSSIVSMGGTRKTVASYVGYPKDPVSRKLLKADIIYGKHALDNRLAVDLYRPLENGVIKYHGNGSQEESEKKNLQAAAHLLKHLVDLSQPGRDQVL